MSHEQFDTLLPLIITDLISMIVDRQKLSEQDAIRLLYHSKLYASLELENTKLWQYSTPMLYSLLEQELSGNGLCYPDV